MKRVGFLKHLFQVILLTTITLTVRSQENKKDTTYVPHVGQPGKDVIWVPTPDQLVAKMLEVAEVTANDIVVDLGSGDGRTVIAAAKLGAHAVGIELNPDLVELSIQRAKDAGVSSLTKFIVQDLFEYDLSKATVITMFLLPEINLKLRPVLLKLKPGTRIVSNTFTMGDWIPDFEVMTEDTWNTWYNAMMWIIPAKIDGKWKFEGGELEIRQEYQFFYGSFNSGTSKAPISDGRITGDKIEFRIYAERFTGQFLPNGNLLGTVISPSSKRDWMALPSEK
jgi:SAM-dependent methyltransferase